MRRNLNDRSLDDGSFNDGRNVGLRGSECLRSHTFISQCFLRACMCLRVCLGVPACLRACGRARRFYNIFVHACVGWVCVGLLWPARLQSRASTLQFVFACLCGFAGVCVGLCGSACLRSLASTLLRSSVWVCAPAVSRVDP